MLWKIEHFWCWQVRMPVGEYLGQVSDDWALVTDRRPTCACAPETGAAGPLPGLCCGVRTPVSWTRVRAQEMGWWNTLSGIWCLHSDHSPRPLGKGRELDHPRPARGGCWRLRRSDHRRDASVSCLPPARYGVLWGRIHHGPGEEHQGQHAKGRLDSLHLQGDPAGKPPLLRFLCICCLRSVVSVQSLSRVRLLATPWTVARQASLSFTSSQSLFKLMFIESAMPSDHLTLCHPPSPAAPNPPGISCHCTDYSLHNNQGFFVASWLRQLKPHHDVDSGLYLKKPDF